MGVSSGLSVSASKAIALTVVAIAIILFVSNITITNAQQQQPLISQPPTVTQNGTTLFQSTEDGIRMMVPEGWIIHDVNNTGSTFSEESRQGYGILAQLCPQEQEQAGPSNVSRGGGDTVRCQGSEGDIIHIVRYPDLDARLQAANNISTTNNNNMTIDNILLYHMQKLGQVGYRGMEIMDNTDTTLNVTNAQTNQTIATVPAKNVEMTYNTNFAPNETRTGYFILTATNETAPSRGMTKGYSIFYEGPSTTAEITTTSSGSLAPRPLPPPVKQVFDSFELVTEVPTAVAAEQQPLTVDITSSETEGGGIAPATFEFGVDVVGGTGPYTYRWDFDDDGSSGEGSDEQTVSHTFEEAGTYSVGLTVTDSSGQSASDSVEITVDEPATTEEEVVEEEEEEQQPQPPAEEVIEEQPPAEEEEGEEPNDADSGDGFDVDEFVDDLFDRLGFR